MIDLAFAAFLGLFLAAGLRRPFIWVLAYLYVDILSPQKISYFLLASLPVSLIVFVAAFGGWLLIDRKEGVRFTFRQALILFLLVWCGYTTLVAEFPDAAATKWAWVWKSLIFAIFFPLTLTTRLRIEAAALIMALSAGAIIISAGIKTIISGGGGYGTLQSFVNDNTGIYEGSTLSTVAIAIIPMVLWLAKFGTVFPADKRVRLFAAALVFACLMVPIGTQTRTGLLCIALLGVLMLRTVKRRFLYIGMAATVALTAIPFLPASYTARMSKIEGHQSDQSASTRVAVWGWTWDYVKDHPLGGGFDVYLANSVEVKLKDVSTEGNTTSVETETVQEKARAFHSAYFEMLGEQGWPGFLAWITLHLTGLFQLEAIRRRTNHSDDPGDRSDFALANALQQGHIVILCGSLFVGIAYQPFVYLLIGLQIALANTVGRRREAMRAARPVLRKLKPLNPPPSA